MRQRNLSVWKDNIATVVFIAINVLLFIMSIFSGDLLYEEGAFSIWYLLREREWWRLITSMFLHADADHLVGNMLMLYLAGELVERYIGKWKFVVLYFFGGICGSLLYAVYELTTNHFAVSIGASGAVFGVVGALLVIVARHRGRYGSITMGRMVFMIGYMIYMGLRTTHVNNAAHIGGLIGGMALMALYVVTGNREGGRRNR